MKQIVKLTKHEANILLSFAKGNMDCDLDCCTMGSNGSPDMVEYVLATYGTDMKKEVKKIWTSIIKKLEAVK